MYQLNFLHLSNNRQMRSEQEIFNELAVLCRSKGYIHAVAEICFRDSVVKCINELRAEDMALMSLKSCLIRTEITTLIGLMMREPIKFDLPTPEVVENYIERSKTLLKELHQVIFEACDKVIASNNHTDPDTNPFDSGKFLREPIFYGGDSAYPFQYRDFAPYKYRADSNWLLKNKNLDLGVAREVCRIIFKVLTLQLTETIQRHKKNSMSKWTMLPAFTFSCHEIATHIGQPVNNVRAIIEAFTAPNTECNATFTSLEAFNVAYAYPFIRRGPNKFILLQYFGIAEVLYETPFYWMCADEAYVSTALHNRGKFTETFASERLSHVFGHSRVFQNVEILESKGKILGEIDVLALFGNRAVVVQAKSKKLTLEARKGIKLQLQNDFKAAVQDSVGQALACADLLGNSSVTLRCKNGKTVPLTERPQTIFPLSVVADHYPALACQTRQFLKVKLNEQIVQPLVIDVFALDTITEMLPSPFKLLSYLSYRARYHDKMMMGHEHTLLSYYLKHGVWIEKFIDRLGLPDYFSSDLDVAMAVRREGVSGVATPEGILTWFDKPNLCRIIAEFEEKPSPITIDLGLMLFELDEDTIRKINRHLKRTITLTAGDGGLHDMSVCISSASTGLTVHCSRLNDNEAKNILGYHCAKRRNLQGANNWFGLALRPDCSVQIECKVVEVDLSNYKDNAVKTLTNSQSTSSHKIAVKPTVDRNSRCPCGSGNKFKHCCFILQKPHISLYING